MQTVTKESNYVTNVGIPKSEGDGSATELLPQTQKEQVQRDFSGKMQDLPEESSLEQQEYL